MTSERKEYPTDGYGNRVSDIKFLLSCLKYILDVTGETMDPEDMVVIAAIRSEQQ